MSARSGPNKSAAGPSLPQDPRRVETLLGALVREDLSHNQSDGHPKRQGGPDRPAAIGPADTDRAVNRIRFLERKPTLEVCEGFLFLPVERFGRSKVHFAGERLERFGIKLCDPILEGRDKIKNDIRGHSETSLSIIDGNVRFGFVSMRIRRVLYVPFRGRANSRLFAG